MLIYDNYISTDNRHCVFVSRVLPKLIEALLNLAGLSCFESAIYTDIKY